MLRLVTSFRGRVAQDLAHRNASWVFKSDRNGLRNFSEFWMQYDRVKNEDRIVDVVIIGSWSLHAMKLSEQNW